MPHASARYQTYLQSPEWKATRLNALHEAGGRCQQCGAGGLGERLDVHHSVYRGWGREQPGDLVVLCRDCHEREHEGNGESEEDAA